MVHPGGVRGVRAARARARRGGAVHAGGPAARGPLPHPDLLHRALGLQQAPLPAPRPAPAARPPGVARHADNGNCVTSEYRGHCVNPTRGLSYKAVFLNLPEVQCFYK